MSKTYYIPIDSVNLSNYYRMAIIAPANYIQNRNRDIQSFFENHILLSGTKFTTETDCALEIIFDDKEEQPNLISDNFYLFDMPLPISRIKRIYFSTEEQKTNTVFNVTNGAAFLPKDLIEVESKQITVDVKEINNSNLPKNSKDWKRELELYDRILGGLATIPISKKEYENYPLNYFGVLSLFNKQVEDAVQEQNISPNTNHSWAFQSESRFKPLHDIIYQKVNDAVVQDVAKKENEKVQTRNGLYVLESISSNTNTYLSAILATYGKDKRKKIDDFISDLKSNKFEENRLEGIALIFGINNGYTAFRNQYKFGNTKTEVKFKLDSKLDFYTIESIYQFVFNRKTNSKTFSYIDNWCPQFKNDKPLSNNYFTILDKHIYLQKTKEPSLLERILKVLKEWFPFFDNTKLGKKIESEINKEIDVRKNILLQQESQKHLIEIQAKNKEIENLKFEVNQQDMEIENLKSEIKKLKSTPPKVKDNIKETTVAEKEAIYKPVGDLFTQNNPNLTLEEKRADELYSLPTLKELKDIAKKCGIKSLSKYSSKNKQKLVDEIVKKEFQQN